MNHPFINRLRELLDGGASMEVALSELRVSGASKMDSIVAVHAACRDLAEAKMIVYFSNAWADTRGHHDELHESMERALNPDEAS